MTCVFFGGRLCQGNHKGARAPSLKRKISLTTHLELASPQRATTAPREAHKGIGAQARNATYDFIPFNCNRQLAFSACPSTIKSFWELRQRHIIIDYSCVREGLFRLPIEKVIGGIAPKLVVYFSLCWSRKSPSHDDRRIAFPSRRNGF